MIHRHVPFDFEVPLTARAIDAQERSGRQHGASFAKRRMRYRRPVPIVGLIVIAVLLLASCSTTVRIPAGPPTGSIPVGRWACINGWPDFDDIKASNSHRSPAACNTIARGYALEFKENGVGYALTQHRRSS